MKQETKTYRMNYSTFKKLRRVFYARENESCADYFARLVEYLEQLKTRRIN